MGEGTYLPIPERLSRIADLGNMSIEELVCGNVEEYILGIILYRDSIVLDGITFPDKTCSSIFVNSSHQYTLI